MPDAARCVALGDVRTLRWPVRRLARVLRRDAELLDAFREALALDFYARGRRPFVAASMASLAGVSAREHVRHRRGESVAVTSNAQAKLEREEAAARKNDQSPLPKDRPSAARRARRKKAASVTNHQWYGGRSRRRSPRLLDAQRRRDGVKRVADARDGRPDPLYRQTMTYSIDRVASDEIRGRVAVRGGHVAAARRPITQKGVPIPRKDRSFIAEHVVLCRGWCFYLPGL